MQTIYLDISNKGVIPTIYAKQGDVGRKFQVVLTDSGLPYVPTGGSAFSVWYSGASGEGNYTDIGDKSAFDVSGNRVIVEMISQMLSNDGDGVLTIVLNDPIGNQISTWNIPYFCEPVPGAESEEARNYYTAFSQAVENLPYPDASLSVAGKVADAAAVGVGLAGKAPAGYGLGGDAKSISDCHVDKSGFYRWDEGCANSPFNYATMLNISRYEGIGSKLAFGGGGQFQGVIAHKVGVQEWEYLNPPMLVGEEYRTTERWNGNPVYTKLLSYSPSVFTATNLDLPHNISNLGTGLTIDSLWYRDSENTFRSLPASYHNNAQWNGQVLWCGSSVIRFELGPLLQEEICKSSKNVYFALKYTKA